MMSMLDVLADVMLGVRHSRRSIARSGVSLPTADRWIKALTAKVPGVSTRRQGKTTLLVWEPQKLGMTADVHTEEK